LSIFAATAVSSVVAEPAAAHVWEVASACVNVGLGNGAFMDSHCLVPEVGETFAEYTGELKAGKTAEGPSGGGAKKLADEFKAKTATNEFATLEFETCGAAWVNVTVRGQVAAIVENTTEKLNFPNPELKGTNLTGSCPGMKLTGVMTQTLVGGGKVKGT
jgi:hypothetical protein